MALHHNPRVVTSGLILALDAADINSYPGSGATWHDVSGNGNDAGLYNTPTYQTNNKGVLAFDGTSDLAYTGQNINWSGDFSLGLWVNASRWHDPSSACGGNNASFLESANGYWNMWGLEASSGGPLFFTYYNTSYGGVNMNFGLNSSNLNQWHYLSVVYRDLGACFTYTDGVQAASATSPGSITTSDILRIGYFSQHCGAGRPIAQFARIEVYNRALSATEVEQNYNATKGRFGL